MPQPRVENMTTKNTRIHNNFSASRVFFWRFSDCLQGADPLKIRALQSFLLLVAQNWPATLSVILTQIRMINWVIECSQSMPNLRPARTGWITTVKLRHNLLNESPSVSFDPAGAWKSVLQQITPFMQFPGERGTGPSLTFRVIIDVIIANIDPCNSRFRESVKFSRSTKDEQGNLMKPITCQHCGMEFVPAPKMTRCPHCRQDVIDQIAEQQFSSTSSPARQHNQALTITDPKATLEVPEDFGKPMTVAGLHKTLPLDNHTLREYPGDTPAIQPSQATMVDQLEPRALRVPSSVPTVINPGAAQEAAEHYSSRLKTVIPSRTISRDEIPGQLQDYKIEKRLGHGAFGIVFRAVQVPLDRNVAVKILQETEGDSEARNLKRKNEFLREAQFTGRLEHPNIVPIHDIGLTVNANGKVNPFYAMKEIRGVSWQNTIHSKKRQENLLVFKHVVNAIRFAHDKNIIHCDLKPDNVMLGEFGEVLLVDWGQAIDLSDESTMRPGGTPAYISPEMARYWCDLYLDKQLSSPSRRLVGYRSDVYLLGALLFEMVAGTAPHLSFPDESPYEVIRKAADNVLADHEQFAKDELMQIALGALRADGFEMIETVDALLAAIHDYETRLLSIELRERAIEILAQAKAQSNYDAFQRARFGFEESLEKWNGNSGAKKGLLDSRLSCAELAFRDQNFDLGIGMLEHPETSEESRLREQLIKGKSKRDRRKMLVRLLGLGLFASLIVGVGFNVFMIQKNIEFGENRDQALREKSVAEEELSRLIQEIEAKKVERDAKQNSPPKE